MRRTTLLALMLGLLVTLAIVAIDVLGAFTAWERQSVDYRYRNAPRPREPMSASIAHVDIDDSALERFGEWPWQRTKLAAVLDELRRAGARTIALDLVLSGERQEDVEAWRDDGSRPGWVAEQDRIFANALGAADCVLGVEIQSSAVYDEPWQTPEGQMQLRRILERLSENIQLEDEEVLTEARVQGRLQGLYRARPLEFKRAAVWQALQREGQEIHDFDGLVRRLAPEVSELVGEFPEKPLIRTIWKRYQGWASLQPHLLPEGGRGSFRDKAPLPVFSEQASAVGFVTVKGQEHADGSVRELFVKLPAPGGSALQFGLAAALEYLGIPPTDVIITNEGLVIDEDRRLPLRNGRLWIDWPTSEADSDKASQWLNLLRQEPTDPAGTGHFSIRELAEVADSRTKQAVNRDNLLRVSERILTARDDRHILAELGDPLSDTNQNVIRDEAGFFLEPFPGERPDEEVIAATRQSITTKAVNDAERRAQLDLLDHFAEWFATVDLLGAEGVEPARREELRRTLAEVSQWLHLRIAFRPTRGPLDSAEVQQEVAAEVDEVLAATRAAEGVVRSYHPDHVHNCGVWREVRNALDDGVARLAQAERALESKVGDKLVFLGWTGTGTVADFVPTAVGPQTPGVVVHAGIANMVITGRAVRFLQPWQESVIVMLLGVLGALVAARFSTIPSVLLAVSALIAYLAVAGIWMFAYRDTIMPIVAPVTAGASSWVACTALQAAISQRERLRITRQFKARVSAQLVDHLVDNPEAVSMTGEEREMTVMFGDLAGFTTISERLGGQVTVSTLNRYLGELTKVLIAQGAYLNKFLGDGLMAFWSAFAIDPDQATKACEAALRCQDAINGLNSDPQFEGIPKLGLRLGIATGRVVVGDCGAPPELNDYTVIGDAVNLAARLESANKQFGTRVLINARTQELSDGARVKLRPVGRIIVVGQTVAVPVFEVLPLDTPEELIALSRVAVEAFANAEFDTAREALRSLEEKYGNAKFAAVYREAMLNVEDEFDGVLHLSEK